MAPAQSSSGTAVEESSPTVGSATVAFGERWEVPAGLHPAGLPQGPLAAQYARPPHAATLYRIIPPEILVEYEDGMVNDHRLVWRNTEEGFLISDLPRDLHAVRSLFEGGQGDRVKGVSFLGNPPVFRPTDRPGMVGGCRQARVLTGQASDALFDRPGNLGSYARSPTDPDMRSMIPPLSQNLRRCLS